MTYTISTSKEGKYWSLRVACIPSKKLDKMVRKIMKVFPNQRYAIVPSIKNITNIKYCSTQFRG